MNLSQMLQQTGAIDSMASELGIDRSTTQTAAGALLPAIVAGLGRSHVGAGGSGGAAADGLDSVLGGALGGGPLDSVLGSSPTPTRQGNDILGQIFGTKDVSRGVAEEVAGSTGLPPELLKKMLPILAMAVVGYLMKGHGNPAAAPSGQPSAGAGGGALGGALGEILGQVVTGMLRR
jgi:hypothetical protein